MTLFPCTYPMIIGYIALLIGGRQQVTVREALLSTFWFFVGFTIIYALFGSIAGLFGQFSAVTVFFNQAKDVLVSLGGIFFIVIGFILLNIITLPERLRRSRFIAIPKTISPSTRWGALLVGAIFAVGWSPCVGPLLGGILVLAATSQSVLTGMLLLAVFSFGMMIPLAFITVLYVRSVRLIKVLGRGTMVMKYVGGILFILLGLLFFFGGTPLLPEPDVFHELEQYI